MNQSIDIDAIKRAHDLQAVVEAELGRAAVRGSQYKQWHCPFHAGDNSPSLTVYTGGHYHCFGCEAHGDVVAWTMQRRSVTFLEACNLLERRSSNQAAAAKNCGERANTCRLFTTAHRRRSNRFLRVPM